MIAHPCSVCGAAYALIRLWAGRRLRSAASRNGFAGQAGEHRPEAAQETEKIACLPLNSSSHPN